MRVCMIIQTFRPTIGGAELQLERLLPYLARRGVRATVMTRAYPRQARRERLAWGEVRRTAVPGRSPLASATFVAQSIAFLLRRRSSLDVLHSHGALSEGTIALGASALGVPTVVTLLGSRLTSDLDRLAQKPAGKLRARLLCEHAWFVALSGEIRAELIDRGVPAERIFDVPNGVDTAIYRPADRNERQQLRSELGLPDSPLAIFVGRLVTTKQVPILLGALVDAPELTLVVAGDGPERARLEAHARSLGVAGRVRFLGFSDRVAELLRASDAFLLPSAAEGLSNALLEAMACGLPCLAAPASGSPLLAEGRGLLLDPADVAAWSAAMSRIASDPASLHGMGERAAGFVRERFSFDAMADRLVDVYRRVGRRG